LKSVQSKILDRLLQPVTLPHFLFGAIRGRSIRLHAEQHLAAKLVVKMDIKNYYPSITNDHIFHVWRNILMCSPRIARLLTKLTTYNRHLPQGAPTSPALANILLASIYSPVLAACADRNITATAWVDDLIFSGDHAKQMIEIVRKILSDNGFAPARKKIEILNGRAEKTITGVRLGKDGPRAGKQKLRDIRAGLHNLKRGRFTEGGRAADIRKLQGQITFVRSLCPSDAVPLAAALDQWERKIVTNGSPGGPDT
jgi:RNA-directed DNA polymerase